MVPAIPFTAALGVIVAIACWTDLRERRIPNWLVLLNLVCGLASVGYALGWNGTAMAALHVVIALAVGMILNARGMIGGGDAKFYASMAGWLPLREGIGLLVSVAVAGLILLLLFLVWRRFRPRQPSSENPDFAKLPYGVAIGIGGLVTIAWT